MKKVVVFFVLVIGLFLVAFTHPPHNVVGKYLVEDPVGALYDYKINIKNDSTFYRTVQTNRFWIIPISGYWKIKGDTLILKEVIRKEQLPKNKSDSVLFDFNRPYVWRLIIKDDNTLLECLWDFPVDIETLEKYSLPYKRVTDEEYANSSSVRGV